MTAEVLMAHNGEFYDFQRIRADLTAQGVRFSSKSDSEILLRLYQRQGLDATLPCCAVSLRSRYLIAKRIVSIWCGIVSGSSPSTGR